MKKLCILAAFLALTACASPATKQFAQDPGHYGLYVATVNLPMDTAIVVKNADTGALVPLKITHKGHDDTGYIAESMPAGHYLLQGYTPDGTTMVSLETPDGYFDVQASCYNYGGHFDIGLDSAGKTSYTDTTKLKDIESLPWDIRHQAADRDVCSAALGEVNQRMAASDAASQLAL